MGFRPFKERGNLVQVEGLKDIFSYLDNITVAGRALKEHDRNVKRLLEALGVDFKQQ